MKSFLKDRQEVLQALYEEMYQQFPESSILKHIQSIMETLLHRKMPIEDIRVNFDRVLNKTETYNTLSTLMELDKRLQWDQELVDIMKDDTYHQATTIALNICDMYGSGATRLFGYIDVSFEQYFPNRQTGFLAKGVAGLMASTIESSKTYQIKEAYIERNLDILRDRGVELDEMAQLVYSLQKPYNPELEMADCLENVKGVLRKQQTFHTIDLSVRIDRGVENKEFSEQFNAIVGADEGLYGIDETVNMSISKLYGMISITNFGYLDKVKPGVIGFLDSCYGENKCNTYIDDTICAIVAAACARLAHNSKTTQSKPKHANE